MTSINPYGIGAGRMVESTDDGDHPRARPRRVNAVQSVEQSRKNAAMREQLAQAERAAAMADTRQREHVRVNDQRRGSPDDVSVKPISRPVHSDLETITGPSARFVPADDHNPHPPENPAASAEHTEPSATGGDSHVQIPPDQPDEVIARLLDALPKLRAQGSTEGFDAHLSALQESISTTRQLPAADSREALESLGGALEFVQGYLEAGSTSGDACQRLIRVIEGIRQEVMVMLSPAAVISAGAMPTAAVASQVGTEVVRVQGLAGRNRTEPAERVPGSRQPGLETLDEESLPLMTNGAPPQRPSLATEPVRGAVPSQERDSDKRREETPVSVAIRSI